MLKKLLAALGTLALVLGLVALVAGPASAHNHSVDASCAAGVTVNLTNYNTGQANANHVTVTIDGTVTTNQAFGGSFAQVYPFSTGHGTHTYRVAVTAYDDQSGSQGWTFDTGTKSVTGCETPVTPAAATSTNAVCTAAGTVGGGGYTIPAAQVGVQYQIWNAPTNGWIAIGAGTFGATPGSIIKIQAVPTDGYKLTGTTSWTFTIGSPDTSKCIVPTPPTANYSQCTATPGDSTTASYTIPAIETGYRFFLQGSNTPLAPGTVIVSSFPTTVVIVATPTSPYLFPSTTTTTWTFTFQSPGDCHATTTPAAVTPQYSSCTATPGQSTTNGFTVVATTGVIYQLKDGNSWTTLTPGFHDLGKSASDVEIQAVPEAHYALTGTTDWKFSFVAAADCLKTVIPNASSTPAVCDVAKPGQTAEATYTLDAVTGVIYSVKVGNGSYATKAAGTYHAKAGDTVYVLATADTGYRVDGAPSWTFTFSSDDDCLVKVPAGDPKFVDGVCNADEPGTSTQGTFTVFLADHVHYTATINGGPSIDLVVGVDNPASPGDVVVITPVADAGYVVTPVIAAEKLTHTFANPGECLITTPFVQPQPTSQSCIVTGDDSDGGDTVTGALSESPLSTASLSTASLTAAAASSAVILPSGVTHTLTLAFITIPSLVQSPHAVYFINGVQAAPGQHILDPGTYTVSAMPETGYAFENYTGPWTEVLTSAEPCGDLITHPLVDPSAVQVQMGCFSDGSYKLSNDLSDPAALTWTVGGATVSEGTYHVSNPGTVTVHVAANGPAYGLEPGATTDWSFHFERPTTCDLKTLALTGSSPTGWIALGYAMLVSGLALLALRFARRRDELA